MMNLFEGNQQILNLYAEIDKPQQFFYLVCILFVLLLVFVALMVGLTGYLAFGNSVGSVLIYSLPPHDFLSILAKFFYVLTILGSFVIVAQPIFYIFETSSWYQSIN